MTSNPFNARAALRRKQADERLALQRKQFAERKAIGLLSDQSIDFDQIVAHEKLWELPHPSGAFSVRFLNGNLYLAHQEIPDAGGMCYSEELSDEALDRVRFITNDFRAWRARQRPIPLGAG